QLEAHRTIAELVQVGMVRNQTEWMAEILEDPKRTGVVIVATPEEMPVAETIDLYRPFQERTAVDLACTVVNRVLPAFVVRGERRRGQDHDGGGGRAACRRRDRRTRAGADRRPGPPAGRRDGSDRPRQRRDPRPRRRLREGRAQAAR